MLGSQISGYLNVLAVGNLKEFPRAFLKIGEWSPTVLVLTIRIPFL